MKFFKFKYKQLPRLIIAPLLAFLLGLLIFFVFLNQGIEMFTKVWGLAIVLLFISIFYIEYFFTTPKDVVVNSLNVMVLSIPLWITSRVHFYIFFFYALTLFILGVISLLIRDKFSKNKFLEKTVSIFGKSMVIFGGVAVFSILNFLNICSVSLGLLVGILLYIFILWLLSKNKTIEFIKRILDKITFVETIGRVTANLRPNIVLVNFKAGDISINDLVIIGDHDISVDKLSNDVENNLGLVLDFIGTQSEDDLVTARVFLLNEPQRNLKKIHGGLVKSEQECSKIKNANKLIEKVSSKSVKEYWKRKDDIVALTGMGSTIEILKGDLVRYPNDLENAQLVSVFIQDEENNSLSKIYYQIIEAKTKQNSNENKKDSGYIQLEAYQLGEWKEDEDKNSLYRFHNFQWVPEINTPIFKWNNNFNKHDEIKKKQPCSSYFLGAVPKTNLPIYLNIDELVNSHSAILGVTGSGKSTLVWKLIKKISKNDVLVICLDITGEYKRKIGDTIDLFNKETGEAWDNEIKKIIEAKKKTSSSYQPYDDRLTTEQFEEIEKKSVDKINDKISERLDSLQRENKITLFDFPEIANTHRSIDVTQYLIQALLNYGKNNFEKEEKKRCLIVMEEAHTLVPENLGIAGDFGASKAVIDKISQIALQGRKYNIGFMLVSQRTANVKKTVLNQANTMISFRAYDKTSYTFLENYYGEKYIKEISNLKNHGESRYVIVGGKAVIADKPVIVEIKKDNDNIDVSDIPF